MRRRNLGWPGIAALAAGFGVLQAGVIDQSMFAPSYRAIPYWDDMVRPTLIEPFGVSADLPLVFVGGHVVWSFCAPIALVEALGGPDARPPWMRARGLAVAVVLYLGAALLVWHDHQVGADDPASLPQVGAALAAAVPLFAAAPMPGRRAGAARRPGR